MTSASASKMHIGLFHLYHCRVTLFALYVFLESLIMKAQMSV